mgnify:CR=1 FL=1
MEQLKAHLCDTWTNCDDKKCFLSQFVFGDVVEILDKELKPLPEKGIIVGRNVWTAKVEIITQQRPLNIQKIHCKYARVIEKNRDKEKICDRHPVWKYTHFYT